ncbi:alpha/beta hydrolase [Pseudophaeobacter sp.]|uniref:esterase/lipase family protein n=1 Tax=Pseudophaeobacter sp. TaxID=1971739 RepID=UPI00329A5F2A
MIFRLLGRMLTTFLLITATSGLAQELHAPGYVRRDAAPDAAANRVVVFVHGLSSLNGDNAASTWTPPAGLPWPLLLAQSKTFRDQDIYVANYDSDAWNGRSFTSVSGNLARQLRADGIHRYSEIYFIGHSLGGLVLRRALLDDPVLRVRTAGLFLFASPTGGSALANLGRRLPGSGPLVSVLQKLDKDGDEAQTILKTEWLNKRIRIPTFCAFESDERIVDRAGVEPLCTDSLVEITGNHNQIVQPSAERGGGEGLNAQELVEQWIVEVLVDRGYLIEGPERYDARDVAIASCPGDSRYTPEVVGNIRAIVAGVSGDLSVGVTRPMPRNWTRAQSTDGLWAEHPPRFLVVHYSCFELNADNRDDEIHRDTNFAKFARQMLEAGVNVVFYSRTISYDAGRDHVCRKLGNAALLAESFPGEPPPKLYGIPSQLGQDIVGGGNSEVNDAFEYRVSQILRGDGAAFEAVALCQQ